MDASPKSVRRARPPSSIRMFAFGFVKMNVYSEESVTKS